MNKPITPEVMKAYVDATWEKCQTEAWKESREWVGLTDEEMFAVAKHIGFDAELMKLNHDRGMPSLAEQFARAVEAKLRSKNGY